MEKPTKMPLHGTPTYNTWMNMIQRTTNPNARGWDRYGGRGITVCQKWKTFSGFWSDMGDRPPNMTLDRSNNDGAYCLENCDWKTRKEQARNRCNNHFLIHNGESRTISEWAEIYRINKRTLRKRIMTLKWPVHKALTFPIRLCIKEQPPIAWFAG